MVTNYSSFFHFETLGNCFRILEWKDRELDHEEHVPIIVDDLFHMFFTIRLNLGDVMVCDVFNPRRKNLKMDTLLLEYFRDYFVFDVFEGSVDGGKGPVDGSRVDLCADWG